MKRRIITEEIYGQMYKDYCNGVGLKELEEKYNFKKQAILKKFNLNGLYFSDRLQFSKEDISSIVADYQSGIRPYIIGKKYGRDSGKKYGRDSGTIIAKLQSLGIYKPANHRFTNDEIEMLKIYYPIGDWETINKKLPHVSKQSIHTKMSKLGIKQEQKWTEKDVAILREKYCDMYGKVSELVDLFHGKYTYTAIISKARRLGLFTREYWSQEEIDILHKYYSNKTLLEIMDLLPRRNRESIINKARNLGLTNKIILDHRFSTSEIEFIHRNFNEMTDKEMGKILNRNYRSIRTYRATNRLLKTYEKSSYEDIADYIRRNNGEWRQQSMRLCNFRCVLTGDRFDVIHHLYGFNLILNDVFDILRIEVKPDVNDYSTEEMRTILDQFRVTQSLYPLGVCLREDVHKLFHSIYGYGNNTAEQWDEFKTKYKQGHYKNLIA